MGIPIKENSVCSSVDVFPCLLVTKLLKTNLLMDKYDLAQTQIEENVLFT